MLSVAEPIPDDDRGQRDPVMRRLLGWPTPIAIAYLIAALAVASWVKWQRVSGSATPAWLWATWVLLVGPLLVSGAWRACHWMQARASSR